MILDVAVDLVQIRLWHNESILHLVQKSNVLLKVCWKSHNYDLEQLLFPVDWDFMFEWILKLFVSKLLLLYSSFAKWSAIHTGYSVYALSGMDLN